MKNLLRNSLNYLYLQFYVTFAIIFFSKERLLRIAMAGGNHPLAIFGTARWARIWWFSLTAIIVWFFALTPWLNLILFFDETTFFSVINHSDEVIYFNKWTVNIYILLLVGIISGKILQGIEIYSAHKMQYFKRHLRTDLPYRQKQDEFIDDKEYLKPYLRKIED